MSVYTIPAWLRADRIAIPPQPPEWVDLALCAEVSGDLFFPEDGQNSATARAVCRSCEARLPCLREATDRPVEGVWGGFSERARKDIHSRHVAGESLEDIIAEDDARYYERLEGAAERAAAANRRERDRQHLKYAAACDAATTDPTAQSREKAA